MIRCYFSVLLLTTLVLPSVAQQNAPAPANAPPLYVAPTAEDKALAAEIEAGAKAGQGTAAQEAINFATNDWPKNFLPILKGEKPATGEELQNARNTMNWLADAIRKGPKWPKPEKVKGPHADTPPVLDGTLDDPVWAKAATFTGGYEFGSATKAADPATTWRVLWDENYLYFGFQCADTDIIAPELKRDDKVYDFDCVEMFILPDFKLGKYWELIVSPTKSVFDCLQTKRFTGWGSTGDPKQDMAGLKFAVSVQGTPNQPGDQDAGYTVEVAVPFKELPTYADRLPVAGDTLNFMFVRLDKNGQTQKFYAFQPLLSWGHNIWNHAPVELAK